MWSRLDEMGKVKFFAHEGGADGLGGFDFGELLTILAKQVTVLSCIEEDEEETKPVLDEEDSGGGGATGTKSLDDEDTAVID